MNNKKSLTVKNMIREYYNAKSDMDSVWDCFNFMRMMGFISEDEWKKFFEKCSSWTWNGEHVIDMNTEAIILLGF